jgi:RND family efflux transporter MFP subunit
MLEQAETALETAQASLQAAQARRGDRVIRAPFSGRVGLTTVTPGTLINPGAVITTLDDTSTIRVDFPLPERYLNLLRPGAQLTATADAYGDEPFTGRIALIDTRVNETTRAATARAEFPNPGGRIRPGMLMRVAVQQLLERLYDSALEILRPRMACLTLTAIVLHEAGRVSGRDVAEIARRTGAGEIASDGVRDWRELLRHSGEADVMRPTAENPGGDDEKT